MKIMLAFPYTPLRRPEKLQKRENPQDTCEHDWQWSKERVPVEDDGKRMAGGHERQFDCNVQFWLKVRACAKCKLKIYTDVLRETV
jgi:hypothetical protein